MDNNDMTSIYSESDTSNFGFWFYFDNQDYSKSEMETFFLRFNTKLSAYRQQFMQTVELYDNSYQDSIRKNEEYYQTAIELAEIKYAEFFDEISGSEDLKHQYAAHFSGINQLEDNRREYQEPLMNLYSEMKDSYFKSATIQLYSLFESTLNGICNILQKGIGSPIGVEDMKLKDYQQRAKVYLQTIINLKMVVLKKHDKHLTNLQKIRNTFVHSLDAVAPKKLSVIRKVIHNSIGELYLLQNVSGETSIHFDGPKYVIKNYELVAFYFYDLFWLIEEQYGYSVNKNRLVNLFSYIDPGLSIADIEPIINSNPFSHDKKILITTGLNLDGKKLDFKMEFLYSTQSAERIEVSVTRTLVANAVVKRLVELLTKQSTTVLKEMFSVFFIVGKPKHLKVKIY